MTKSAALTITLLTFMAWQSAPVCAGTVNAADYSSFWIWGGVKPQPVLASADSLYILQGQISEDRQRTTVKVIMQGMSVARLKRGKVWLVYRADTLRSQAEIVPTLVARLQQWRLAGNPVVGLQIDFDAKTRKLQEYVDYLKQLRARLPDEYRLSITGLLDWSSNGDIGVINQLQNVVDEVTVQTYQGRKTIANCNEYLSSLRRLHVPFKIGLVQNGEWQASSELESNPRFQGYVVFLQNQR